ncbi:MFS transporter [Burkholderia sp. WAC0059]|uniref:MFS transporter n=1 Tax=Burkholderia sp. WAC0059 TaxID=2066022 RepID=UPI000C7F22D9|nr:MFS transporter [Burkholderia sp. WAC0059]PLZ02927.1 MFS transporter [Burkholderia sp. WAC0059]
MPTPTPPLARIKAIQRASLAMLFASGTISTVDRAALAIANPLIRHDMGLSIAEMGVLLSAFLWAYAFAQLPIGWLIDRFGARWLLAGGLAVWSSAQAMCGLVGSAAQFGLARVVLGVGEAPQFPTGASVVRDWFAVRERGRATGIYLSASYFGTGLAAPLVTFLMLQFSWRAMFLIMGVAGWVVALVWAARYRNAGEVDLNAAEQHYRTGNAERTVAPKINLRQWRGLFGSVTTWGLVLGFFGMIYVNWLFNTWLPGYLQIARHMSIARIGWTAAIPYLFAVAGALSAGYVVDWLANWRLSLVNSRKIPACVCLVVQAVLIGIAGFVDSNAVAVACVSVAMFCGTAASTIAWSAISVLAPAGCTGSLGALQNFGGYLGGALAPIVTGLIVQHTGSFVPALLTGAGVSLAASAVYLVLVRGPVEIRDDAFAPSSASLGAGRNGA